MTQVRKESQEKEEREEATKAGPENESDSENTQRTPEDSRVTALTVVHMQGPLMLLVLGLGAGVLNFAVELSLSRCCCVGAKYA